MASWPNLEKLAYAYLSAALDFRVVTRIPSDLTAHLPLVRITRGPGSDDKVTDAPLLDVETFTARDADPATPDLWDVAERAREAMHALAGNAVNGSLVDTVDTVTGPTYLDYGNPAVDRVVASYRLNLRKRF